MSARDTTAIAVLGALGVVLTVHFIQGEAAGSGGGFARVKAYLNFLLTGRGSNGKSWFHDQLAGGATGGQDASGGGNVLGQGSTIDTWIDSLGFSAQRASQVQAGRRPPRRRPARSSSANPFATAARIADPTSGGSQSSSGGTVIANP